MQYLERTPFLVLSNVLLYYLIFYIYKPSHKNLFNLSSRNRILGFFLMIVFCVLSFWGTDWFHSYETFPLMKLGQKGNEEDVYLWIAQNLSPNYYIFRLVIWGSALFLLRELFKLIPVKKDVVWYIFVVFGLIWLSYARVSLAMVLMFTGVTVLYSDKRLSFIIGTALIISSFYFHKSAFVVIAIITIVYFFDKLKLNNKIFYWVILLLLPISLILAKNFLITFSHMDDSDSLILKAGQQYMEVEGNSVEIGAFIQYSLLRISFFISAYLSYKILVSKIQIQIPNIILVHMRLLIAIVLVSIVLMFDLGFNTSLISRRLLLYSYIPASVIISYFLQNGIYKNIVKFNIRVALLSTTYALLYTLYCAY